MGVCFDKTQGLRRGAGQAPSFLRAVFPKLETFIFGVELGNSFIEDLGDVEADSLEEMVREVGSRLRGTKKLPIIMGGEHTITLAGVKAVRPDKVVVMDAHPDCEDSAGHDGIVRRLVKEVGAGNVILYGVRVASRKEHEFIRRNKIRIVRDKKELERIKGRVYLSVDFDVLDPSVIHTVGNPEPMGLSFAEASEAIRSLADRLVAVDFVEFTPIKSDITGIYALMAGKLIYATMAGIKKARK